MTQLDAEASRRRRLADDDGSAPLGGSSGDEGLAPAGAGDNPFDCGPGAIDDGAPLESAEDVDFDELAEDLQGIGPEEAEKEARDALRRCGREHIAAADVLAILLKTFRLARDAALEDYDGWDKSIAYCDHLAAFCDKNFMTTSDAEAEPGQHDLPAPVVATVYAECGRTLALADKLPLARDRLEKALNVFAILPGAEGSGTGTEEDDAMRRRWAAAVASLARVYRRLRLMDHAEGRYVRALQLYATLPVERDMVEFMTEFCDVIGEKDAKALSPALPSLLVELTEAKFQEGSAEHLKLLMAIATACQNAGRADLACPALVARADALRGRCGLSGSAWAAAEAEAAEEEAAGALEACLPARLEAGDLSGAAGVWEQALRLRERLEGPDSDTVSAMRQSLAALQEAVRASGGAGGEDDDAASAPADSSTSAPDGRGGAARPQEEEEEELEDRRPDKEAQDDAAIPEAWDDDDEEDAPAPEAKEAAPAAPQAQAAVRQAAKPSLTAQPADSLRPRSSAAGGYGGTSAAPLRGEGKGRGQELKKAPARPEGPPAGDGWDA